MKEQILDNLNNPETLEKLYHSDRKAFREAFQLIYPDTEGMEYARFWKARLDYNARTEGLKAFSFSEISGIIAICLITAFLIRLPAIINLSYPEGIFFMKNAAIIVFLGLSVYTFRFNSFSGPAKIIIASLSFLVPAIYMNLLPSDHQNDALNLAYIHLPLLMWFIYGMVFTGFDFRDLNKRIAFIRYNGDLVIIYAIIAIAGGLLTAITIGLFDSIGLNIEKFYGENIVVAGAVAAPVVAAFLIEKFPAMVSKTAPLIATIFSPMVLITLIIFLTAMLVTGKDPYNDRDFLLIFNVMLLGVMTIIIFSVSETSVTKNQIFNAVILLALSAITIVIDVIALSAIFYRLGEYGLTPNRLAVLISNILVLLNLILIMTDLFRINFKRKEFRIVEMTVAKFLPVYLIWIIIVVFTFPVIFGIG
jgi:hypothetical protein